MVNNILKYYLINMYFSFKKIHNIICLHIFLTILLATWSWSFFERLATEIIDLEVIHLKMITESLRIGELDKGRL